MQLSGIPGIIPARWVVPLNALKCEVFIVVNWLEVELPRPAPMQKLDDLRGWRNREVYEFVRTLDWTASMYDDPIPIENVRWP